MPTPNTGGTQQTLPGIQHPGPPPPPQLAQHKMVAKETPVA